MFFGATAFAEVPFSALGGTSIEVQVTGVQANTALGNESIGIGVDQYLNTNLLQSTVNSVNFIIDSNVLISTNLLQSTVNSISIQTGESVSVSTNLLQSTVNNVSFLINSNILVSTNLLQTNL